MLKVILVASGKGGTGKTSLTAGVGAALAANGHRVLVIDGDCGLRNLDIVLGMSDRVVPTWRAAWCSSRTPWRVIPCTRRCTC